MSKLIFTLLLSSLMAFMSNSQENSIYVRIKESKLPHEKSLNEILHSLLNQSPGLVQINNKYSISFLTAFDFTEERWLQMHQYTMRKNGSNKSIKNLERIYKVHSNAIEVEEINTIIKQLQATELFDYVSKVSLIPTNPPADIPPTTPDLQPEQTYIGPNPGVNMEYAWSQGLFGSGIRIRDVEYGVNVFHEDLEDQPISIFDEVTVSTSASELYTEHGTAVFGILMANAGTYGITGLVHQAAEGILFPEWTNEHGYDRILAVSEAIDHSEEGDFVIYEMQTGGQNDNYVPAEYNEVIWDLTYAATDLGIIVVAAAGNGNENLDDPYYDDYNARGNSGALIVGAGTSNLDHNKMSFSTYGSRVNIHAWGQNALSSGYGNDYEFGGDYNQRYRLFSGTSSATPIVASCAIALQSYYFNETGEYLTTAELIEILEETGIPQGSGGHIGPLPNMEAAFNYLNSLKINPITGFENLIVYPNPSNSIIYISNNENVNFIAELYNAQGQAVVRKTLANNDNTIDVSNLVSGIYILKLETDNGTISKRISVQN